MSSEQPKKILENKAKDKVLLSFFLEKSFESQMPEPIETDLLLPYSCLDSSVIDSIRPSGTGIICFMQMKCGVRIMQCNYDKSELICEISCIDGLVSFPSKYLLAYYGHAKK